MTRIVTSTYRYKRPPRKRKAVALAGPAVVTARSVGTRQTPPVENKPEPTAPPPANDDSPTEPAPRPAARKPAIVTTTDRKRSKLLRAEQRAQGADDAEVSPEVKAFFARMVRPGGALPPKR